MGNCPLLVDLGIFLAIQVASVLWLDSDDLKLLAVQVKFPALGGPCVAP
mgnify:CR=1 FL=1